MQEKSQLSVLVVDPNPGLRGSLQSMLNQSGVSKIEYAVSAGTAIRQLFKKPYDIILCEYDLGSGTDDGQDGQQLLEDLRHHKLIGLPTIFIMLTSERTHSKVVSMAELTPTDYILKPFTVQILSERIARALDRREVFLPAHHLIGKGNSREAIAACRQAALEAPRYKHELARLRAELHVSLNELEEAAQVYRTVLADKAFSWASLGLARTMFAQGKIDEAQALLEELLSVNPRLMGAYDLLARCHAARNNIRESQKILEEAVLLSPHVVRRLRALGEVALEAGDAYVAEKSFRQVVSKGRYSEFRNPEDHVSLVRALAKKGDTAQAGTVIRDLERSLRSSPELDVCKALSVASLHEAGGDHDAAAKELLAASTALRFSSGLSGNLKIGLARSCLSHKLDAQASEVMLSAMNDVDGGVTMQQALAVFMKAGRPDLAEGIGNRLKQKAQELLNVADEKRNMGDVRGAVQTLLEALHVAPGNLQVMIAVAGGILRQINELGWEHQLAEQCRGLLDSIRALDGAHPRLAALSDEYAAAKRKYGIAA